MTARRIAIWAGGILVGLVLLVAAILLGLNTGPGKRFVTDRLAGFTLQNGMSVQVGRIEGSIYGAMTLHDVRVRDTRGVFLTAPRIAVDWRPFAYANGHVDVRSATAPLITLMRLPALKAVPSEPNAPILPDLDIDIGRLRVDRLVLEAPVSGQRRVARIEGTARIADRRAQVWADAAVLGGGDRLRLVLDAVPDENKLDIDARLEAPRGGVVASMAGLQAPLSATLGGRGSWQRWDGRLQAVLGGQPLANLAVAARDGALSVRGPTRPGLIVPAAANLTAPVLNVDASAKVAERVADTRFALRSDALAVDGQGEIDLARSRFGAFRVDARLIRPASIAPNLNGRDVRLRALIDGPMARPVLDYRLTADRIGFGATVVEQLAAGGRVRVNADRILIPVAARAARVSGLNAQVGGLLTNVRIDGQLAFSGDTILSDNLRIRSDRVNATAIVVADLSSGVYRGGLKGRINNYLVQGIGIIGLETDVDLVTTPQGGFALTGRFAAQTVRIDNESVRNLVGGRTLVSGRLAYGDGGVVRISRLRLAAPKLRITDGGGSYRPDGRVDFRATGVSDDYGPVTVFVTGTAQRPQIRLRASRPNIGVQLTNVDAIVRSVGDGYAITATGGSPYGPFSADIFVRTGRGPLAVDIRRAVFAGVTFRGRVVQTAAGPFTGQLGLEGQGLVGVVRLGAEGRYQTAQVSARANGAAVPSNPPIQIARAIVEARLVLYPNAPLIVADVQAAGVRQGTLLVEKARARINYQGGRGTAALVANGQSGATFNIAANADLSPGLYRVAANGRVNSIAFRTARAAVIRSVPGGYELEQTAIVLPQGQVRLAGRYAGATELRARFDNLDLSVLNAFAAGAGVGGRATGSLTYAQTGSGFPRADLRLDVDNFTRSGAAVVSEPVDVAVIGALQPEGGTVNALIRRGGAAIGRLQVRLQPSGGGSWTEQLMAGSLGGGVRYNGPASVLWSLTGIADQQLTGPIGLAADFSGRVNRPQLAGVIRANALGYVNETYGTRIRNIRLTGRFTNDRLEIAEFAGQAGEGTIAGRGTIGLSAATGYPIDLQATLNRARLARSDALGATATGELRLVNNATGATISGDLRLPEVRYEIVRQGAAEVAVLEGVRRKGAPPSTDPQEQAALPGLFNLDIRLRADNRLFVSGMGLESEWASDLRVTGTSAAPIVTGQVDLVRGTYSFAGRRFELDQTSRITFLGNLNPTLNLRATGDVEDVEMAINIGGRALSPQVSFSSTPALPQDELLSRILFGGSVSSISAIQAVQLAAALNSLRGSGGGLNPLGKLRSVAGIDRLRILGGDETTGRGTAVAAGTYISNDVYVEVITDARGFTATQISVALTRALSVLSQVSSFSGTNVELRYRKDY